MNSNDLMKEAQDRANDTRQKYVIVSWPEVSGGKMIWEICPFDDYQATHRHEAIHKWVTPEKVTA